MRKVELDKQSILYYISLVGGIASICSLVYSIASIAAIDEQRNVRYMITASIIYIFALFCLQFYMMFKMNKLSCENLKAKSILSKLDSLKRSYQEIHSISHQFRDCMMENKTTDVEAYKSFCISVLDNTRTLFQDVHGVRCSTCIKIYSKNENALWTFVRDSGSIANRSLFDNQHPVTLVSDNTASMQIIEAHQPHYLSNDLEQEVEAGRYINNRSDWKRYYLSTICLPIRYFNPKTKDISLIGLLCIDSHERNHFDEDYSIQMGACITDMIYPYLHRFDFEKYHSSQDGNSL
ncbi:hypothetical protein LLH00_05935 [bacterium]|nr:hypothetical protein [bacterium]